MNVQRNINVLIEERRLAWFGHLKKVKSDRIPQMILEWNVEYKKRKGNVLKNRWSKKRHDQQRSHRRYRGQRIMAEKNLF